MASDRSQRRLQWLLTLVGVGLLALVASNAIGTAPTAATAEPSSVPVERVPMAFAAIPARGPEPDLAARLDPLAPPRDELPLPGGEPVPGAAELESFECLVEPYYLVDVGSPVTGAIESIAVERGDSIEAGQVLVLLESGVERAAVAVARGRADMSSLIRSHEARVALGEQRKRRADRLFAGDALSQDRSEEAETEAILARLELEQAREKMKLASLEVDHATALLERRSIRSPVSGIVVERRLDPGEVVDDETILRVAQIDPLRVQVVLPGALFGSFQVGQRAAVQPELPGAPARDARVVVVDRLIDAASGTFGIQLELPNPDESIPGGVHCQVRFFRE